MSEQNSPEDFEAAFEKSWNSQGRVKIENYVKEIAKTNHFRERVLELRKKYDIPEGGFSERAYAPPEDWKHRFTPKGQEFSKEVAKLCADYGLHFVYWSDPIQFTIFYDEPPQAMHGADLCMLVDLHNEAEEPFSKEIQDADNHFYPIAIRISPQATQRDIVDYVEKHARFIRQMQEHYLKDAVGQKIGKVKKKDPKVQERNDFIYKNQHLPRRKIMEAIVEKFGADAVIDYGHISKIISLEKKKRKEM
jgi:hypothetical protein